MHITVCNRSHVRLQEVITPFVTDPSDTGHSLGSSHTDHVSSGAGSTVSAQTKTTTNANGQSNGDGDGSGDGDDDGPVSDDDTANTR